MNLTKWKIDINSHEIFSEHDNVVGCYKMVMIKAIGRYNIKIKNEIVNKMVWMGKDKNKYIIDDIGDAIYQVKKTNSQYYQYKVIGG